MMAKAKVRERRERCDSCEVLYINGVRCHEHGCPEAWRDLRPECRWCGSTFEPQERGQSVCSADCGESYFN